MANHDPGQVYSPGGSQESAVPPAAPHPDKETMGNDATEATSAAQPFTTQEAATGQSQEPPTPDSFDQPASDTTDSYTQPEVSRPVTAPQEATPQPYQPEQFANFAPRATEPVVEAVEPVPQPAVVATDEPVLSPYALEDDDTLPQSMTDEVITWTASEYIAHHKTTTWYLVLAGVTVVLAALIYFLTSGDIISIVVVILVMVVFGMYAARKPVEQEYTVSNVGIAIGQKGYPYTELKSFGVIDEGPFSSIVFMPMKRFMPTLTMYYDPKDEERILTLLSSHLPNEQNVHDRIDRLMKKIRF